MASASNLSPNRGGFTRARRAAIGLGTVLVISVSLPLFGTPSPLDLLTLGLLAVLLYVGATKGARAGGVAAIVAAVAYALVRMPDLLTGSGSKSVATSALTFGLVGLGSGLTISRMKKIYDRLAPKSHLDTESHTYAPEYIHEMIRLVAEEHRRYGKRFGLIEVPPVFFEDEMAEFGPAMRNLTRSSDFVGRSWDGGFLILLPNTDRSMAEVVAQRLEASIHRNPQIPVRTYSAPEDLDLIDRVGVRPETNGG